MTDLLTNGDFELGNNGFSSSYTYYTGSSIPVGSYSVGTDPADFSSLWPTMGDHTSGSGYMLMANSSSTSNTACWTDTVTVSPYSNANVSFFTFGLYNGLSDNNAQLDVYINGEKKTGGPFVVDDGVWKEFTWTSWYSNINTSATIEITPIFGDADGRDFAIDDITFDGQALEFADANNATTYLSYFKDVSDIHNPEVSNSASMQYTGSFEQNWDFSSVEYDSFGFGLEKTKYNHGSIFCEDSSKLFSMKRGYVKLILSFKHAVVNGVHERLSNSTYHNEYILWGVNMGELDVEQPGIYAALTNQGLVFKIKSAKQTSTVTYSNFDIEADEDTVFEFMWDIDGISNDIGRTLIRIDGDDVGSSYDEFAHNNASADSFTDVPFHCLNTSTGLSDLECTIKHLRISDGLPADVMDEFFSSSSSSSSSSSDSGGGGGPIIGVNQPIIIFGFIDECINSGYDDPAVRAADINTFNNYISTYPPLSGSRFVCFCCKPPGRTQPNGYEECENIFPGPSSVLEDEIQKNDGDEWTKMQAHFDAAVSAMYLTPLDTFYLFFSIDNSGSMTDGNVRAAVDNMIAYALFHYPNCVTDDTYGSEQERWILDMLEAYSSLEGD